MRGIVGAGAFGVVTVCVCRDGGAAVGVCDGVCDEVEGEGAEGEGGAESRGWGGGGGARD